MSANVLQESVQAPPKKPDKPDESRRTSELEKIEPEHNGAQPDEKGIEES